MQKGNEKHALQALEAARKAFPGWSRTPWQERVRLLRKVAALIEERFFEMSTALSLEVGKNRMEAFGDVQETADLIKYACDQMETNQGYTVEMGKDPLVGYDATNVSILRPYGVWLVISPFNFPCRTDRRSHRGGAGGRQYGGHQACHRYSLDRAPAGRMFPGCRLAGRRAQFCHRTRQHLGPGACHLRCGWSYIYRVV